MEKSERFNLVSKLIPYKKYGNSLRLVDVTDAEFILGLRSNQQLAQYLSNTNSSIDLQQEWLRNYKERETAGDEFYFISIAESDNHPLGVNRLYNIHNDEFEIGSWLYSPQSNISISILGDLAVRDIGFELFKLPYCKFEVRKNNKSVVQYHKAFKPQLVSEDDLNYFFRLDYDSYTKHRNKLLKILGK